MNLESAIDINQNTKDKFEKTDNPGNIQARTKFISDEIHVVICPAAEKRTQTRRVKHRIVELLRK